MSTLWRLNNLYLPKQALNEFLWRLLASRWGHTAGCRWFSAAGEMCGVSAHPEPCAALWDAAGQNKHCSLILLQHCEQNLAQRKEAVYSSDKASQVGYCCNSLGVMGVWRDYRDTFGVVKGVFYLQRQRPNLKPAEKLVGTQTQEEWLDELRMETGELWKLWLQLSLILYVRGSLSMFKKGSNSPVAFLRGTRSS